MEWFALGREKVCKMNERPITKSWTEEFAGNIVLFGYSIF
jgi:hypothetical protein